MSDNNGKTTFTLAEVRAAFKEGANWAEAASSVEDVSAAARSLYPDPEPERRWVDGGNGYEYARDPDGRWWSRRHGDAVRRCAIASGALTDSYVLALASLLPRVPVEVTEEMVEKVRAAFFPFSGSTHVRLALTAVAADLAQPVVACQHRATRWAVVDENGGGCVFGSRESADTIRERWGAPHRVVALAEVEEK